MMQCMKCGGKGDVMDSRPGPSGIWRRRRCRDCGDNWITMEQIVIRAVVVKAVVDGMEKGMREITDAMALLKQIKSRGGVV